MDSKVRNYSDLHIILLDYFSNPKKFKKIREMHCKSSTYLNTLYLIYPHLRQEHQKVLKVIMNLYDDELINFKPQNLIRIMEVIEIQKSYITVLGDEVLDFLKRENILFSK